jgi:hypothetical protein
MALPANIRINASVPFPAMVTGSGPITIGKANGIWTVGLSIAQLQTQIPPGVNAPNDYLLLYDSVANQFFKTSIQGLLTIVLALGGARFQRSVTASPIVIQGADQLLNVNISAGNPTCALPVAS